MSEIRGYLEPSWPVRRKNGSTRALENHGHDLLLVTGGEEQEKKKKGRGTPFFHTDGGARRGRVCTSIVGKCGLIWLILPVVICLSQRLSHACLSTYSCTVKPRMAH